MAAKKLDNKFSFMLANLQHLQSKKDKYYKMKRYAFKACIITYVHIYCLKNVYKRVHLKELCFIKLSLYKLKTKMAKMDSVPIREQTTYIPIVDLSSPLITLSPKIY